MRPPIRSTIALLALLAPAAAASGGPHGQAVGRVPVSDDGEYTAPPLAVAPGGGAAVAGGSPRGVLLRRARPGAPFGRARRIGTGRVAGLAMAHGDRATAVAWSVDDGSYRPGMYDRDDSCCRRLRAAVVRGGHATHARVISSPGANAADITAAVAGRRAAVAWTDARGVRVSLAGPAGGFGRPRTVSSNGLNVRFVGLVLGPSAAHLFLLSGSRTSPRVIDAWTRGGSVHRRSLGRARGLNPYTSAQCTSPAGGLMLVGEGRAKRILVSTRRPGRRVVTHSFPAPPGGIGSSVACTLTPAGRGTVALVGRRGDIEVRAVSPRGTLGPAQTTHVPGTWRDRVTTLGAGMSPHGRGVLTASASRGRPLANYVLAWPLAATGRTGAMRVLSGPHRRFGGVSAAAGDGASWVSFAIDHDGYAAVGP